MDLLKYTKFGFYIKLVSSILAVLFFPLMFFSGFFDNEVANSDKGWNFIAGFFYLIFAIIIIISGLKEKDNKQPMYGCLIQIFFGLFLVWSLFWLIMSVIVLVSSDNTGTILYYSGYSIINLFVSLVSLRELFIKKLYNKTELPSKTE